MHLREQSAAIVHPGLATAGRVYAALLTATIFLGAGLLFLIQPMFTRMILPLLGGAPAVWNTSVLFYQAVLLLGYGYVHLLVRRLSIRNQVVTHLVVLLLPALVLPIGVTRGLPMHTGWPPIAQVLLLLAGAVGLPFFVVSATNPLLQSWFSRSGHHHAGDPYFLYAASNAGSMLGLLGYPFVLEPALRLAEQSWMWTLGYATLLVLLAATGIATLRCARAVQQDATATNPPGAVPVQARRRLTWILLAALPSSLMLSVTTFITTDIAPIPLLWAVPLALYLVTFILAFSSGWHRTEKVAQRGLPFVLLGLAILICVPSMRPLAVIVPLHLLAFTWVAFVCHRAIANDRPAPEHLTEYYFWISAGGVLGGAFNALVAPVLFSTVLEYPLGVVAAALVGLLATTRRQAGRAGWLIALGVPGVALAVALAARSTLPALTTFSVQLVVAAMLVAHAILRRHQPVALAFALGALLWLGVSLDTGLDWRIRDTRRSFFGVNRVAFRSDGQAFALFHGRTIHGVQYLDPALRQQPTFYYHRSGPLGAIFAAAQAKGQFGSAQVGVVGLGAGSASCYKQPGQHWTMYEIDPDVVAIAHDTRYFSFLSGCAPDADIQLGDARLELQKVTVPRYNLLILDAYSSDAIPVHLMTREAFDVYTRTLAPGGMIAMHITNRYLDLEPVVAALARDRGLVARIRSDTSNQNPGAAPSTWVAMARSPEHLGALISDPAWHPLRTRANLPLWTDDFASIIPVLR